MGASKGQWGWKASFWFQKKCYKKEGFRTKAEAKDWEVDRKRELEEEAKRDSQVSPLTFFGISAQYLEDCQARMQVEHLAAESLCLSFVPSTTQRRSPSRRNLQTASRGLSADSATGGLATKRPIATCGTSRLYTTGPSGGISYSGTPAAALSSIPRSGNLDTFHLPRTSTRF